VISIIFRSQEGIFPPGRPFPFEDEKAAHLINTGRAVPASSEDFEAASVMAVEQFVDPNVEVLNDSPDAKEARDERWKKKDQASPHDRQVKTYVRKGK
jgi:hypothetical protein